jgi:hypothetical protein
VNERLEKEYLQQEIEGLKCTISEMLYYIDKEQKRLCMNFFSYAIGKSVKRISGELKKIAGMKDEV